MPSDLGTAVASKLPARLVAISFSILVFVLVVIAAVAIIAFARGDSFDFFGLKFGKAKDAIPEGAVVAFVGDCPAAGWSPYAEGAGKVIIGANGEFTLGQPGGSKEMSLGTENTPKHSHAFQGKTVALYGSAAAPGLNSIAAGHPTISLGGSYTPEGTVAESGNAEPFSILPPYIALNLCRKVGA